MVGWKGLDSLAFNGDVVAMKKALVRRKDLNAASKNSVKHGRRPLHAAVLSGHEDMVDLLLRHGALVNARDDNGGTPLHYAASTAYLGILELLLANGADHTVRDKRGNLPIHVAVSCGHTENQERLRQRAVEVPLEVRYFEGGEWHPYDASASRAVSFELGDGSSYCALATSTGGTYIVDFREQLQINASSLFAKSVCWRVPPMGAWNTPEKPWQGLHPGSQDPRYLAPYAPLLQELQVQGRGPQQPIPLALEAHSSYVSYPRIASTHSDSSGIGGRYPLSSSFNHPFNHSSASVSPLPSSSAPVPLPLPRQHSFADEPPTPSAQENLLNPHRASAPRMPGVYDQGGEGRPHFLSARPAMFKALRSGSVAYNEVVARFMTGMEKPPRVQRQGRSPSPPVLRPVTVTCVYEVNAPEERIAAFEHSRRERISVRGSANERLAWHGAPFENLEQIVSKGFKLSSEGRNGRLYGQGVYFAPERQAHTSAEFALPDGNGEKHMLLCRVIVGAIEAVPFESVQRGPSSPAFDTGADNASDPTRYVIWEDDVNEHVLPTHVVSFKYC
eukprot:TRINITY_DN16995_c0_g1_i1.p1 TRINITY_DN16995_c0_g1~~TRINITY_DN16995_c0_g1_i1.p1  ORF type:complete len:560 (-),score=53.29 TRINITY_DN16995_c0_g1_i1:613-2292(-)